MKMAKMNLGAVSLEYDTFGDKNDETILLIMGLGGQMILWENDFCNGLASRGFHVIRFDNRDVGLSTWFDEAGVPDVAKVFLDGMAGLPVDSAYTLDDMADDCVGLLRGLGIERAHIAGGSMGGMIAQAMAINHPDVTRSLTSIMSTTGRPGLPGPTPDAAAVLATPPPETRDEFITEAIRRDRVIGSPDFPPTDEFLAARAARGYDRAFHPTGTARQLAAVAAHGDRTERLQKLTVPTLVIHGDKDPLIPIASGQATHEAISGSEFLTLEGMGHDMPRPLWPQIIDGICRAAARAKA
jgi:pimeloyl-ACP methyl ester carboxylesterase